MFITSRISLLSIFLFVSILNTASWGQTLLDIEGKNNDPSTLVKIISGELFNDGSLIALEVKSQQVGQAFGIAGQFTGSTIAVFGISQSGQGIRGKSTHGTGIFGESTNSIGISAASDQSYALKARSFHSTGAFIRGGNGIALELGGSDSEYGNGIDDSVIKSETGLSSGDLILVSNDIISLHIDDDGGSNSKLQVLNGANKEIMFLTETGNMDILGSLNQGSDVNRKHQISSIDPQGILERISDLPVSEWSYKGETVRHVGPMAQDFYDAFGLGQGKTTISSIDADGVALAAIKALKDEVDMLKESLSEVMAINQQLSARVDALTK